MSDHLRFLVTVDSSTGAPVKVEQLGQDGDLAEVDLASFLHSLGAGHAGAGALPQVVVNIYTTGAQGGPGTAAVRSQPERLFGWDPGPPPVVPPPGKPGRRSKR